MTTKKRYEYTRKMIEDAVQEGELIDEENELQELTDIGWEVINFSHWVTPRWTVCVAWMRRELP